MRVSRLALCSCVCGLPSLLLLAPLLAQPGKNTTDNQSLPLDLQGTWSTSEGETFRLIQPGKHWHHFYANEIRAFVVGDCHCSNGGLRTYAMMGSVTGGVGGVWQGQMMLCTPADLYRDCHGKGLTPDSDAWVTDFKADIVDQATIQVRYRNQHYNVQKDMQTGQVISCKNDYDFDVNMTLKRLPPLKDPFAHPPLPTSPPTTPAPHDGNSPLGPILDKILYSPATHPLHRSH